jgi:thioredoxin reductase
MRDGRRIARHALAVGTRMEARVAPFAGLGLTVAPHPGGSFVEADAMGRTAVPGVWVAGNAGDLSAQVGAAAAAGVRAAAAINADLVMQDADAAVARRRTASAA